MAKWSLLLKCKIVQYLKITQYKLPYQQIEGKNHVIIH